MRLTGILNVTAMVFKLHAVHAYFMGPTNFLLPASKSVSLRIGVFHMQAIYVDKQTF